MLHPLRKFSITDRVLDDICTLAMHNPDQTCMLDDNLPMVPGTENRLTGAEYYPASLTACKAARRPKKMWNAFIKMNIYNFMYVATKPGYHSFVCKAYNGQIFNVDIKKRPSLSYKRAVIEALVGLTDQILEIKVIAIAQLQKAQEERQAQLRAKFGDVNFNLPEGVELTDELVDSIGDVLDQVKDAQVAPQDDVEDAIIVSETVAIPQTPA